MKIIWSPLAIERVSEIVDYISQDNPAAAERWALHLFDLVERLNEFPESGRVVPEIKRSTFREILTGNYRVIYKIEGNEVFILTVRHGKQLLPVEEILA